jgi:hypothetical protein
MPRLGNSAHALRTVYFWANVRRTWEVPMALDHVNDEKHWRDRADQMRVLSIMMKDLEVQTIVIRSADDYEKLANRAAQRANGDAPRGS